MAAPRIIALVLNAAAKLVADAQELPAWLVALALTVAAWLVTFTWFNPAGWAAAAVLALLALRLAPL